MLEKIIRCYLLALPLGTVFEILFAENLGKPASDFLLYLRPSPEWHLLDFWIISGMFFWHLMHLHPELILPKNWHRPGASIHDGLVALDTEIVRLQAVVTGIIRYGDLNPHHRR